MNYVFVYESIGDGDLTKRPAICPDWNRYGFCFAYNNYGKNLPNILPGKSSKIPNCIVDKALFYFQALQVNPRYGDPLSSLGINFKNIGRFKLSKYFQEKCLEIDPHG